MMAEFRADLHTHSTYSDGSDTPLELLQKAKQAQLQGLSITDHDTIDAYTPEVLAYAKTLGLQLLSGIELSSEIGDATIHVLGYGFDLHSGAFAQFLAEMQERRRNRNRALLKKLAERKMVISEEELTLFARQGQDKKSIGRPHIAELMVQKGYVGSRQEAFDRYLKEGSLCYVSGFKLTPEEAIVHIHEARGKAVLAHPCFIPKGRLLNQLLKLPFDGIECYYATLYPALVAPWLQVAKDRRWIATGGSDYHGAFKPHISLGASWVDEVTFQKLSNHETPS